MRTTRLRRAPDLRFTLLLGFAGLAILPVLVAVLFMARTAEEAITRSTGQLARISQGSLADTSAAIGELSRHGLSNTGDRLTDLGSRAVLDTAGALLAETERQFGKANADMVARGEVAQRNLTRHLIAEAQRSHDELGRQLGGLSDEANRDLAGQTGRMAEGAISRLATSIVEQARSNSGAISEHVVEQSERSARLLSSRLAAEIEREPVVNFKRLALIFARGIATNKVSPLKDGYLAVVDAGGRVVASTRYRRGTRLRPLGIVEQALGGAPEDTLVRFRDGSDDYLGVFARREDGGAVVFAYLADRARADTDRAKEDVQRTMDELGTSISRFVIGRLQDDRDAIRQQATALSRSAIGDLQETSRALGARTRTLMSREAEKVSKGAAGQMARKSRDIADQSAREMKTQSRAIAATALGTMRRIGAEHARQAQAEMRSQAGRAVSETVDALPRAARKAGLDAVNRMAGESRGLADQARNRLWLIGAALLAVEVGLAIVASLVLSGRIAAPILSAQRKAQEDKERLTREMEIASRIQACLFPPVPEVRPFDVAARTLPAEEVGGDFVDLLAEAGDGAFWVGIGDVTGHGLTPGLIMMMAQSTFNALARSPGMTPKSLYDGMNRVLYQNIKSRLRTVDHMTLSVLRHDGGGAFVHCGAHLPLLIFRAAAGRVERVATDGPWIGLVPECQPFTAETRFELAEDDVLLLYTDGLIEVQNAARVQWDMERLCEAFRAHAGRSSAEILDGILAESLRWAHRVQDDISLVVLKRTPVPAPA